MLSIFSLTLIKMTLMLGLGFWLLIGLVNNLIAFRNGVFSLGGMMAMKLFDQQPAITTPLLSRRVESPIWHRLVYSFVIILEGVTVVSLLSAGSALLGASSGLVPIELATAFANLAITAFMAMSFAMLLGGAWFVYYIRQEGAQITHLIMIGLGLIGAIVNNLPVSGA
jgi:predicted small integral membrane protein